MGGLYPSHEGISGKVILEATGGKALRIIQIAHALTLYDGASKFVMKLDVMFNKLGYKTAIFAHKLDEKIARQKAESGLGLCRKPWGNLTEARRISSFTT